MCVIGRLLLTIRLRSFLVVGVAESYRERYWCESCVSFSGVVSDVWRYVFLSEAHGWSETV